MARGQQGHRWFAAVYDSLTGAAERALFGPLRARLLVPLQGRVLEVGCGTGASLPYFSADARVIGVEPDPYMLRHARHRMAGLGYDGVELIEARAEELPFAADSFDHVVCTLVLCTVADVPAALAEIRRVLRPGGRLHTIEHVRADGWLGKVQDLIRPLWGYFGAGCNPNRRTAEAVTAAGFVFDHLEVRTYRFGFKLIAGTARPV